MLSRPPRHLLLLGGGHAHLEVLRQLAARPLHDARVTLVSMSGQHHYSSVVPGYIQGRHREHDFTFDLRAICRAAGATFIEGCAESIDAPGRRVIVLPTSSGKDARAATASNGDAALVNATSDARRTLCYDALSIDVGSDPAALDTPGVREHASTMRPMTKAIALKRRLDGLIATALARRKRARGERGAGTLPIAVVGAGAGGVEIALAIACRVREAGLVGPITLIDQSDVPLRGYAHSAQRRIKLILERRGIWLRFERTVRFVESDAVHLDDGERCDALLTVWLTGAAASGIFGRSAVTTGDNGFLLVDDTLRAIGNPQIWGAGDCVTFRDHPQLAKAGVYAVREGPILAHNLRVAIDGGRLRHYAPQSQFLSILDTGDGRGLLCWHGLTWYSRGALMVKRIIDRLFVRKYQRLGETPNSATSQPSASPNLNVPAI